MIAALLMALAAAPGGLHLSPTPGIQWLNLTYPSNPAVPGTFVSAEVEELLADGDVGTPSILADILKRLYEKAGSIVGSATGAAVGAKIGLVLGGVPGGVLGGLVGGFLGGSIGEVLGGKAVKPSPWKP